MAYTVYKELAEIARLLVDCQSKVEKASERRMSLPPGSSRAKVTSANARYMAACENRDREHDILLAFIRDNFTQF